MKPKSGNKTQKNNFLFGQFLLTHQINHLSEVYFLRPASLHLRTFVFKLIVVDAQKFEKKNRIFLIYKSSKDQQSIDSSPIERLRTARLVKKNILIEKK